MTNEHSHSLSTPFSKPTNNHLTHIHTSILPSAITSQRTHNTHSYTLHTCCTHFHRNPIVHKNLRTVTHNILQPHNSVSFVFEEHLISPWACTSAPQFYLRWKRTVHLMARWITCTFSFLIYIQVFPTSSWWCDLNLGRCEDFHLHNSVQTQPEHIRTEQTQQWELWLTLNINNLSAQTSPPEDCIRRKCIPHSGHLASLYVSYCFPICWPLLTHVWF